MNKPYVFQDENATYTFIVGTDDPKEAEVALRKQEEEWFGPLEGRAMDSMEAPLDFDEFYPVTFYVRGDYMHWDKEALPKGKGRIAERKGFMAPLD